MPKDFTNAFTCNTLDKPLNAFLDRFGKLVALADQLLVGEVVYFIVEESALLALLKHLKPYASPSGIRVEVLHKSVLHVLGGERGELRFPQPVGYLTLVDALPSEGEISEPEYELLRIENNLPRQGVDFRNEMFLDLGIDAISFKKGCYLGQEVMARGEEIKHTRKLVRVLYKEVPAIVTVGGEVVGKVTSSCFSQKYGAFLCFALIKRWEGPIDNGKLV